MASVFVSYPRSEKNTVRSIVSDLKLAGLDVFWDDHIVSGNWEDLLMTEVRACKVFIVLITAEVVERGKGSYVYKEITEAIESETDLIVPIVVGELNLDASLQRLNRYHSKQVDKLSTLFDLKWWQDCLINIKKCIESGGHNRNFGKIEGYSDAEAAGWPVTGDDLIERQSMALAIVMLEWELPFLVTDAAVSLRDLIEKEVRPETKKEANARPRSFVARSQSDLLASIGARRQTVSGGVNASMEVVRFSDRDHRVRLLEYLWKEQPTVRALLIRWVQTLIVVGRSEGFALHFGRGLSHLAQIDLPGLRYEVINQLLTPPVTGNQIAVLSELLAIAFDEKSNQPIVRDILKDVLENSAHNRGVQGRVNRNTAVRIALGALAERTPAPAIEVLKDIQPYLFKLTDEGRRLRFSILSSPMLYGRKAEALKGEGYDVFEDELDQTEDSLTKTDGVPMEVPEEDVKAVARPDDVAQDNSNQVIEDETPQASAGLPAAAFLRALARWIDEKIPSTERKLLIKRQSPLWIFLSAFAQMPLYAKTAPQRLSLEELVFDISQRNGAVMDDIEKGMVRAALARPQSGSSYLAFRHLQGVCTMFAHERHKSSDRQEGEDDAYLVFARRIYRAIAVKKPGCEDTVLRGSGRYLTSKDILFITTAPELRKDIYGTR